MPSAQQPLFVLQQAPQTINQATTANTSTSTSTSTSTLREWHPCLPLLLPFIRCWPRRASAATQASPSFAHAAKQAQPLAFAAASSSQQSPKSQHRHPPTHASFAGSPLSTLSTLHSAAIKGAPCTPHRHTVTVTATAETMTRLPPPLSRHIPQTNAAATTIGQP